MLSAILTNQQTCLEGIQATTSCWSVQNALFNKAWMPKNKKKERKLLDNQINVDDVLVKEIVTVSQDGSGNFTTINDVVAATPNKSEASKEYVTIDKKKKYLMMKRKVIEHALLDCPRSVSIWFSSPLSLRTGSFVQGGLRSWLAQMASALSRQSFELALMLL
ncbi:unnamed protein product [Malus baccata var. baccata]